MVLSLQGVGGQNQGARKRRRDTPPREGMRRLTLSRFSFIRTVTVGPGIAPGLLTLRPFEAKALAGSRIETRIPPVGNLTPP